jgi:hypothetical protein
MSYHNLGQLDQLIATVGSVASTGIIQGTNVANVANTLKYQLQSQKDQDQTQQTLMAQQIQFNQQQLAQQTQLASGRNATLIQIAIYLGIALGIISIIVTGGTFFLKEMSK